uniref:Uncharacterized protein n=1 Tax=Cyclophora tenuis TaxID=216820 RepID=A0A7S1GNZ0_CYCTE|mmetsp:Transcript_2949/g.5046  ORF Transcript_2949/g.5046 Transcript_2949/m.5046 type:complete len:101 (+) Transcript_2949:111-413(+)
MKSIALILFALLVSTASAFVPMLFGYRELSSTTVCFAKHVNKKAAKWAAHKRPRKSRPSDKNRKPVVYELTSIVKPPEWTVVEDAPETEAAPAEKDVAQP